MGLNLRSIIVRFANWLVKTPSLSHFAGKVGAYFYGPIVFGLTSLYRPSAALLLEPGSPDLPLKRFTTFLALMISWRVASAFGLTLQQNRTGRLEAIRRGDKSPPLGASWFQMAKFIFIALITIFSLEAFRNYFGENLFAFALILMTLGIIPRVLEQGLRIPRPMPLLALSVRFLYWGGIALLSYYCIATTLPDPAIVLGFAFGSLATSMDALWMLDHSHSERDYKLHVRAFTVLALAAPMLTGILVYTGQLAELFLLSFLPGALVMKLPEKFLAAAGDKRVFSVAVLLTTIDAIFFDLIIFLLMRANR